METSFTRFYASNKLIDISMTEIEELIKNEKNKSMIAEYVYQRFYNRFLKIFDYQNDKKGLYIKKEISLELNVFNEEYKNGFLMMASCSLLIETFAAFLEGHNETAKGKSVEMYSKVFERAELKKNPLKVFKNEPIYKHIRCGILHQGESTGKFKIRRSGKLFDGITQTINAQLFLQNLNILIQEYRNDLQTENWDSQLWEACRMKIRNICFNAK